MAAASCSRLAVLLSALAALHNSAAAAATSAAARSLLQPATLWRWPRPGLRFSLAAGWGSPPGVSPLLPAGRGKGLFGQATIASSAASAARWHNQPATGCCAASGWLGLLPGLAAASLPASARLPPGLSGAGSLGAARLGLLLGLGCCHRRCRWSFQYNRENSSGWILPSAAWIPLPSVSLSIPV